MGASIVMTVVNCSISLSLGFDGTVETNINNGGLTKSEKFLGYRGDLSSLYSFRLVWRGSALPSVSSLWPKATGERDAVLDARLILSFEYVKY